MSPSSWPRFSIRHNVRRITYVRSFSLALSFVLSAVSLVAQNKEQGRLENAGLVMEEILDLPDSIPQDLLNKAECVIVVPSMTKVAIAIGIGGSYGRGAMGCRSGANFDGAWGSPAMSALDGGSFGLQLGSQSTDLVLASHGGRPVSVRPKPRRPKREKRPNN
jgi:SH3 domain-containing YSC84-like protein 1